jgi:hypothetical protein
VLLSFKRMIEGNDMIDKDLPDSSERSVWENPRLTRLSAEGAEAAFTAGDDGSTQNS